MGLNHLEISEITKKATTLLVGKKLDGIEFVEFPITVPDLNIAFQFGPKQLVFSLKPPWTGVFLEDAFKFRKSNLNFKTAFGDVLQWTSDFEDTTLTDIHHEPGERVVRLSFSNGANLEFHLFGSRTNWIYKATNGKTHSWRSITASTLKPSSGFEAPSPSTTPIDLYEKYLKLRQTYYLNQIWDQALSQIQERLGKQTKQKQELESSLQKSLSANQLLTEAEELKANLHEHPDNSLKVQKLFAKYKKLNRTKTEVEIRLKSIKDEIAKTVSLMQSFRNNATRFEPNSLEKCSFQTLQKELFTFLKENGIASTASEAEKKKPANLNKTEKKWKGSGIRSFTSKEGLNIWVGKNHKENEELVIRLANGNDLWFHLKGLSSAHAIVRLNKGKSASLETMLDAANLVGYFSGITKNTKIEVDYTFRKNVKRVAGKMDGKFLVTYTHNKTLIVTIDEQRLARLLAK